MTDVTALSQLASRRTCVAPRRSAAAVGGSFRPRLRTCTLSSPSSWFPGRWSWWPRTTCGLRSAWPGPCRGARLSMATHTATRSWSNVQHRMTPRSWERVVSGRSSGAALPGSSPGRRLPAYPGCRNRPTCVVFSATRSRGVTRGGPAGCGCAVPSFCPGSTRWWCRRGSGPGSSPTGGSRLGGGTSIVEHNLGRWSCRRWPCA
jgi:hypothetical protein